VYIHAHLPISDIQGLAPLLLKKLQEGGIQVLTLRLVCNLGNIPLSRLILAKEKQPFDRLLF
jgi:hypothetical protein